jgi:hypothetical protein
VVEQDGRAFRESPEAQPEDLGVDILDDVPEKCFRSVKRRRIGQWSGGVRHEEGVQGLTVRTILVKSTKTVRTISVGNIKTVRTILVGNSKTVRTILVGNSKTRKNNLVESIKTVCMILPV